MKSTEAIPGLYPSAFRTEARVLVGLVTVLLLVFALAPTVGAVDTDFEIIVPVDTHVKAPEDSETILSTTLTPEALIGETCTVTARSENQSSVHPDNDLVVDAGTRVVLPDVEAEPGGVVTATETLVLSDEIVISLIMGPDEVFSAGIDVRFDCPPEETTTTSEATTTTISEETTTTDEVSDTTTTTSEATTTTSGVPDTDATTTSVRDEVLETVVLPYTGLEENRLGLFALTLVASGLLVIVGGRTIAGSPVSVVFPWRRRCAECDQEALYRTPHGILCHTHMRQALYEDTELWMPVRLDQQRSGRDDRGRAN